MSIYEFSFRKIYHFIIKDVISKSYAYEHIFRQNFGSVFLSILIVYINY